MFTLLETPFLSSSSSSSETKEFQVLYYMTMFLITTAIDLLFPSTEFHFMCITKCMKPKQLLLMKIMLALSLYLETNWRISPSLPGSLNSAVQAGLVLHDFFMCNFTLTWIENLYQSVDLCNNFQFYPISHRWSVSLYLSCVQG